MGPAENGGPDSGQGKKGVIHRFRKYPLHLNLIHLDP